MLKLPNTIEKVEHAIEILRRLQKEVKSAKSKDQNNFIFQVTPKSFPYGIWFRGEGDYEIPLVPRIFRLPNGRPKPLFEPSISNHLQTRIQELFTISNPFDRLCLAQHYDIPTRLLDWTESILIGLYFAVISGGERWRDIDGKLYILNAYTLNYKSAMEKAEGRIHTSDDFGTLFRAEMSYAFNTEDWAMRLRNHYPEFKWKDVPHFPYSEDQCKRGEQFVEYIDPLAVVPVRRNHRMIVQSSVFTLNGGSLCMGDKKNKPRSFPEIYKKGNIKRPIYLSINIPKKRKEALKRDLFNFGIHQGTLFPEMDKQYEYLTTIW